METCILGGGQGGRDILQRSFKNLGEVSLFSQLLLLIPHLIEKESVRITGSSSCGWVEGGLSPELI